MGEWVTGISGPVDRPEALAGLGSTLGGSVLSGLGSWEGDWAGNHLEGVRRKGGLACWVGFKVQKHHMYVGGESRWKLALERGVGDTGLGVTGHDLSVPFL